MPRRDRGDGALFYSDKLNRWVARVVVNGKRYNASVKGEKPKKDAKPPQVARELLISLRAKAMYGPKKSSGDSKTLVEVVEDFIRRPRPNGPLSPSTLSRYEGILESKIVPTFGDTPVSEVTRTQIREFYAKELAKTESTTLLKAHNLLSAAIQDAIEDDVPGLLKNVCAGLRPNGEGKAGEAFAEEERDKLLTHAVLTKSRDVSLLRVAFETGLRSGELLGLRWDDIDFVAERLRVSQSLLNVGETPEFKSPKNGKTREVPLSPVALSALRSQQIMLLSEGHPRPLVFPTREGHPANRNHVRKRFQTLCKSAGVRVLDFHATRRTFGSILKKRGVDIFLISRLIGHSSVTTTEKHYVRVEFETLKKALLAAAS